MHKEQLEDVFQRAVELNRQTFEGEEYDGAYHALMLALHSAQRLGSVDFLREVEQLATTQLTYIDTHRPEYSHSSGSAQKRGNKSIFETAAQQAKTRILMIEGRQTHMGNRH